MLVRLVVAMAAGAIIGCERELIGKEAGIRTSMLVSGGAAIFAMLGLTLPYIVATSPTNLNDVIARNSGFLAVVANIVVGVGFLGAGIIFKDKERVHGLTTAAVVWTTAALGAMAGAGLWQFTLISTLFIAVLLFLMRKIGVRAVSDHE